MLTGSLVLMHAHVCCSSDFSRAIIASTRVRACSFLASRVRAFADQLFLLLAQAAVLLAQATRALGQLLDAVGQRLQLGDGVRPGPWRAR